jgi:phospholipase C
VCGDLTSAFQPSADAVPGSLAFPGRESFLEQIYEAQFKELPAGWKKLSSAEIAESRLPGWAGLPTQEPGVRRSAPLPYELQVDGKLSEDRREFEIGFKAGNERFGSASAGAPFIVYAHLGKGDIAVRNYAVAPGDRLEDTWALRDFVGGKYDIYVYGPNGFFRQFMGSSDDPAVSIELHEQRVPGGDAVATGNIELRLNMPHKSNCCKFLVVNRMSHSESAISQWDAKMNRTFHIDSQPTFHWYDVEVRIDERPLFLRKYAGRVETGAWGFSDPTISPANPPSA